MKGDRDQGFFIYLLTCMHLSTFILLQVRLLNTNKLNSKIARFDDAITGTKDVWCHVGPERPIARGIGKLYKVKTTQRTRREGLVERYLGRFLVIFIYFLSRAAETKKGWFIYF